MERRNFIRTATTAAGMAFSTSLFPSLASPADAGPGMIYRTLGSTGERVSALGLGGYHIGNSSLSEEDSIRLVRTALDRGMNFLDNCWDYNGGVSEIRMGKALQDGYRQKAFLMSKIDGRTKEAAAKQIDESLQRLQTDHLDLMQFHEVIRLEDPDLIFAQGGAMEAMLAAKQAGKVRYIGFTGHKDPYVHLRMLAVAKAHNFHFDTVQMPLNVMDAHFRSFGRTGLAGAGAGKDRRPGDEGFRLPLYPGQQNRPARRVPALLPESACFRADHRDRQHADSGSGIRGCTNLQPHVAAAGRVPARPDEAGRYGRQIRAIQDDQLL